MSEIHATILITSTDPITTLLFSATLPATEAWELALSVAEDGLFNDVPATASVTPIFASHS